MKKIIGNKYVLFGLGILFFFILWEIISLIVANPIKIFPDPISTLKEVGVLFSTSYLYKCVGATFQRMIIGFEISFILALIIGSISGNHPKIQLFLKPLMTVLKSVPTAAIVFIFLALLGVQNAPILMVILVSFTILYDAVVGGFNNIDPIINEALEVDGITRLRKTFSIKIPLSTPYILVGISTSFALSFKLSIMSEIIAGGDGYGLGSAIKAARVDDPSNIVPIFAYSFIAIAFVLLIDIIALVAKSKIKKEK